MALVILSALFVAAFAITFKYFERFGVPLHAAITVNYLVAFLCGLLFHPPWNAGDLSGLWIPAIVLGFVFVSVFTLIGISAQRAGAARTTIAGRMSLILTVAANALLFHESVGPWGWCGIALSIVGLVLATTQEKSLGRDRALLLPFLIFLGSGLCDIGVSVVQRTCTTEANEAVLATICFGAAGMGSLFILGLRRETAQLRHKKAWLGGVCLGAINYTSLYLLVAALAEGSMSASVIFPLMNVGAILFSSLGAIILFSEVLSKRQWVGIVVCVVALLLIMRSAA